jgi:hypothetical protein
MTKHVTIDMAPSYPAPEPESDEAPTAPPLAQIVPAFAPVPRAHKRVTGWTAEVQHDFIQALAETGSVRAACAAVGRADHGAYMLRRHPEAEEFRRAWDAALDIALRRIEDVAMDRALNGHEQQVYSYGKHLGSRTVYNDRLLMFMLRNRAPERFGGGLSRNAGARGPNAIDEMKLARLKKHWRAEWDAEAKAKAAADHAKSLEDSDEILLRINAKLERGRENWLASMSPRVRALHQAYQDAEALDAELAALPPMPLLPGLPWHKERRGDRVPADEAEEDTAKWYAIEIEGEEDDDDGD